MGPRVLALCLVPPDVFARLIEELRARHPESQIAALVGTTASGGAPSLADVDEVLDWRSLGRRALLAEVRKRRFDLLVVAHGRDQYATCGYWKALGLALVSQARAKVFSEDGRWGERGATSAVIGGVANAALQVIQEICVAGLGLLVLLWVLVGVAVTDLTEALAGSGAAGAAKVRGKDGFDSER